MFPSEKEALAYRSNSFKTLIIVSYSVKNKIANNTTNQLWAFPPFA